MKRKSWDQVLSIVNQAANKGDEKLDFSGIVVTSIGKRGRFRDSVFPLDLLIDELSEMKTLRELDLSRLGLKTLPAQIGQLSDLTMLILSYNQITSLPSEICQLEKLEALILDGNQLTSLPPEIGKLKSLIALYIDENQLTSLPNEIGFLRSLQDLYLNKNDLSSLPPSIGNLGNLKHLFATSNKIESIPLEIGKLRNIQTLSLKSNKLSTLPDEIGDLLELEQLSLNFNSLETLPKSILKLNNLSRLNLAANKLQIPPEVLDKEYEPSVILSYYFEALKKPLDEAKMIIVGEGGVGKTSLAKRVVYDDFSRSEPITEGISITNWQLENQLEGDIQNSKIKLNVWDFGGQEIMHATHQFFLTKRCLYLLVLDSRLTQEENRAEYWLRIIQSFGGDSSILIIGNKIDQHPLDINRTGLQKKYPNLVGILETSASTGSGIEELKIAITEQINNLPHVRDLLPDTWFIVKEKVEALGQQQNFITHDQYLKLCDENEVSDKTSQRTLIGFLHDLGVVLHFQDDPRLEALGILNPQWVTNGVYKILNSHALFQNKGELTREILNEILNLPEYPASKRLFIVDMMRKFELCYDIEPDKKFLVPDLLPKHEPFTGEWESALAFQYQYHVLPSSIITRFIVRMNAFVHQPTTWRSGTVLSKDGNTAFVKADYEDKTISILVSGSKTTRRDFLALIRGTFDAIHQSIARFKADAKVPHPDHPDLILDHAEIIEFERQEITEFPRKVGSQIVMVNVKRLLAGVEGGEVPEVFISYAHTDDEFVQKLAKDLIKANISIWQDRLTLEGGDIWADEIERGILQSKLFLVVLSPEAVPSDWVKKEYTYALSKGRKVVPIMYKECDIPFALTNIQFIDFSRKDYVDAFSELTRIIEQG